MKRFTVTVTEIGQEVRQVGKKWQRGAGESPDEYGYAPEIETICDYEREVYRQNVDELDLTAVISAVNGLKSEPSNDS